MSAKRLLHDDDDMTIACPECDKAGNVRRREHRGNAHVGDTDAEFICQSCSATFNEYVEREKKTNSPGGINAKYRDLTPEDLGLDDAPEPEGR